MASSPVRDFGRTASGAAIFGRGWCQTELLELRHVGSQLRRHDLAVIVSVRNNTKWPFCQEGLEEFFQIVGGPKVGGGICWSGEIAELAGGDSQTSHEKARERIVSRRGAEGAASMRAAGEKESVERPRSRPETNGIPTRSDEAEAGKKPLAKAGRHHQAPGSTFDGTLFGDMSCESCGPETSAKDLRRQCRQTDHFRFGAVECIGASGRCDRRIFLPSIL